jgi:carbohydrate diacid regulator
MVLNEIIAENLVNRLSALLNKKITVGNSRGDILASSELAETGKNYDELRKVAEGHKETETKGPQTKTTLPQGIILPITYSNEIIGAVFIEDRPEEYEKYRKLVSVIVGLLMHQNLINDSFPYKDKIKDNFVYGMLHRRLSLEDSKVKEEAELFEINLNRDKVIVIVSVPGFWESRFNNMASASEEEKQTVLSGYKKRLFQALSEFFGRLSGCTVSYFGSDTFVAMVDELYSIDGKEMVDMVRSRAEEFNKMIHEKFEPGSYKKLMVGVGSFYKGKEGAILAYEEAKRALNLGISMAEERLIYHIDDLGMVATLAGGNKKWQDNFVKRLLMKLLAEDYLLETVEAFFDKNMSLTQTSKELKIHRNTLLYRLDKIKKVTGLDPRKFNDAMELKVALILNKVLYLERNIAKPL